MNKIKWRKSEYTNDITRARNYARAMGIDWKYKNDFKSEYEFAQGIFEKVDEWEEENQMNIMDMFEF